MSSNGLARWRPVAAGTAVLVGTGLAAGCGGPGAPNMPTAEHPGLGLTSEEAITASRNLFTGCTDTFSGAPDLHYQASSSPIADIPHPGRLGNLVAEFGEERGRWQVAADRTACIASGALELQAEWGRDPGARPSAQAPQEELVAWETAMLLHNDADKMGALAGQYNRMAERYGAEAAESAEAIRAAVDSALMNGNPTYRTHLQTAESYAELRSEAETVRSDYANVGWNTGSETRTLQRIRDFAHAQERLFQKLSRVGVPSPEGNLRAVLRDFDQNTGGVWSRLPRAEQQMFARRISAAWMADLASLKAADAALAVPESAARAVMDTMANDLLAHIMAGIRISP